MAYLFSRRQGVSSHLQMIWGAGSFILLLYWNWCSDRLDIGVSVNLWIVVKDVKPLVVYDVECEMAMNSMKGKCASSWVDLGFTNLFCIPEVTSLFFFVVTVFLGILFSSIREIEVPYVFDWEHGTLQHEMPGNRASSCGEWEVSWVFSSCRGTWYIFSSYGGDGHLKLGFVQRSKESCLVIMDNSLC